MVIEYEKMGRLVIMTVMVYCPASYVKGYG